MSYNAVSYDAVACEGHSACVAAAAAAAAMHDASTTVHDAGATVYDTGATMHDGAPGGSTNSSSHCSASVAASQRLGHHGREDDHLQR